MKGEWTTAFVLISEVVQVIRRRRNFKQANKKVAGFIIRNAHCSLELNIPAAAAAVENSAGTAV